MITPSHSYWLGLSTTFCTSRLASKVRSVLSEGWLEVCGSDCVGSGDARLKRDLLNFSGQPEYGAFISPQKSLATFSCPGNIPRLPKSEGEQEYFARSRLNWVWYATYTTDFPYCGMLIDTSTLELKIDFRRSYANREYDGLQSNSRYHR